MNFQLWTGLFLIPLEFQVHTVPHLKALRYDTYETIGLSCDSTFSICQDFLKSGKLLHTPGFVDSEVKNTEVEQSLEAYCTQGVLASKFPILIQTQPQGHYRCQKVQKVFKNHVPVSNFATMHLNLRKTQINKNFGKRYSMSKEHLSGYFFPILNP